MIRSTRIPAVLDRICDDIMGDDDSGPPMLSTCLLVTSDGELLGTSSNMNKDKGATSVTTNTNTSNPPLVKNPEAFGTLLAEITMEYQRLGEEYSHVVVDDGTGQQPRANTPKSAFVLLLELEIGLVGITACPNMEDCLVMAVGLPGAPLGLVKSRIQALAIHISQALSTLT